MYTHLICFKEFSIFSSIDPEQKDQLVEVIEKLLGDKTTVSSSNKSLYKEEWWEGAQG